MKKLIILVLFAFMSSFVMANEAPDTVQTDFKHVVYKDVKDVIKSLADALKVGTEHVYGILLKQQMVNSITLILVYLIFLTIIIFLAVKASNFPSYNDRSNAEDDAYFWYLIPAIILAVLWVILFSITIQNVVTGFVNPEYGAIIKIIEMLK